MRKAAKTGEMRNENLGAEKRRNEKGLKERSSRNENRSRKNEKSDMRKGVKKGEMRNE